MPCACEMLNDASAPSQQAQASHKKLPQNRNICLSFPQRTMQLITPATEVHKPWPNIEYLKIIISEETIKLISSDLWYSS